MSGRFKSNLEQVTCILYKIKHDVLRKCMLSVPLLYYLLDNIITNLIRCSTKKHSQYMVRLSSSLFVQQM